MGKIRLDDLNWEKPGSYEFTCGMGMVRGKIVAERNA